MGVNVTKASMGIDTFNPFELIATGSNALEGSMRLEARFGSVSQPFQFARQVLGSLRRRGCLSHPEDPMEEMVIDSTD